MMKMCKTCYDIKPIEEFSKSGIGPRGEQVYKAHCRLCINATRQSYYSYKKKMRPHDNQREKGGAHKLTARRAQHACDCHNPSTRGGDWKCSACGCGHGNEFDAARCCNTDGTGIGFNR